MPLTFLPVVLTIAVAMFEIIGKGDVNLNVGEVACVGSGERIGLIGGIAGIPGTYDYLLLVFIRLFHIYFVKLNLIFKCIDKRCSYLIIDCDYVSQEIFWAAGSMAM